MKDETGNDSKLRYVAGCMTGTSLDALDVALVRIEGRELAMKASLVRSHTIPLGDLAEPLRGFSEGRPMTAGEVAGLAEELAHLHLKALMELLRGDKIDLIAVHGQTVYHSPPASWQLINPVPIAFGLDVPVVYDLRAADIALGGQGAPITPLADFIMFRGGGERRSVVNLGGVCNITQIPGNPGVQPGGDQLKGWTTRVYGKDVCVCNLLLDLIARELLGLPFDPDGVNASRGRIQADAVADLTVLLKNQAIDSRSLGVGDVPKGWLEKYRNRYSPQDIARTACAAIATTLTLPGVLSHRILAGGGVANATLVREIRERSRVPVDLSDDYGVPAKYREAAAVAVLGALCADGVPITLPQVTGVLPPPVSGSWVFPGRRSIPPRDSPSN